MAGQGARFGYQFKPFLEIEGQPFIAAALAPFREVASRIDRFVFVYLEAQEREFSVRARMREIADGLPFETVLLPQPTRGPAETIGTAIEQLGGTGPAFICDCDHALDVAPLFERVADGRAYE